TSGVRAALDKADQDFEKEWGKAEKELQKEFQKEWEKALAEAGKGKGLGTPPAAAPGGTVPGEPQGRYSGTAGGMMGQKVPPGRVKQMYGDYTIKGDSISYTLAGRLVSGTITVNPSANPPQLDFTAEGNTSYCIYKYDNGTLTLCMGGFDPSKRPK